MHGNFKSFDRQDLRTWIAALSVSVAMLGCAPKVEQRVFTPVRQSFETEIRDADLDLDKPSEAGPVKFESLEIQGEMESAALMRSAELLRRLGRRFERPQLIDLGENFARTFYSASGTTTKTTFADSLYIQAAAGETKDDVVVFLDDMRLHLRGQAIVLAQGLDKSVREFGWPKERVSMARLLEWPEAFLTSWLSRLESLGVDSLIANEIRAIAPGEFAREIGQIRPLLMNFANAPTLTIAFRELQPILEKFKVQLYTDDKEKIDRGIGIGATLDNMSTAQDALALLIDVWRLLDPEARKHSFEPASKELYDYFLGLKENELNCLAAEYCSDIILSATRRFKLYPALEDFGIANLRVRMDQAGREYLFSEVETRATAMLPKAVGIIKDRVLKEVDANIDLINSIRNDFHGYLKQLTRDWSQTFLGGASLPLHALEASRVKVQLTEKRGLAVRAIPVAKGKKFETGSEVIGASMALAGDYLLHARGSSKVRSPEMLRLAISQFNKLLALGGFKTPNGRLYRSYAVALDPGVRFTTHLNLRDFLAKPLSFGVPDQLQVSGDFSPTFPKDLTVTVGAQAELLRGLSVMIRYLRDWEANNFDVSLGHFSVRDLLGQQGVEVADQKLFPKELLFSLGVGNAAVLLQKLQQKLTPVFLMDLERKQIWANDFDFSTGNSATMAAIVDIIEGKRQDSVSVQDIARFSIALCDFLDALAGVEATKGPPLLERDSAGRRAVDELLEARQQLKNLVLGLSNFISRQMRGPKTGVHAVFDRATGTNGGEKYLIDQALAVKALVCASRLLEIRAYAVQALEIYYYMNRRLWNPEQRFYVRAEGSEERATLEEVLTVVDAIEDLKPFLPERSRQQWERLSLPWLATFENI